MRKDVISGPNFAESANDLHILYVQKVCQLSEITATIASFQPPLDTHTLKEINLMSSRPRKIAYVLINHNNILC